MLNLSWVILGEKMSQLDQKALPILQNYCTRTRAYRYPISYLEQVFCTQAFNQTTLKEVLINR